MRRAPVEVGRVMPKDNEAARIAALIQLPSQEADRELANFLVHGGRNDVVARLLQWEDPAVRFWAISAAERFYPRSEYAKVLERAARDPDDDVSADAIDRLFKVAPERLKRFHRLKRFEPPRRLGLSWLELRMWCSSTSTWEKLMS